MNWTELPAQQTGQTIVVRGDDHLTPAPNASNQVGKTEKVHVIQTLEGIIERHHL